MAAGMEFDVFRDALEEASAIGQLARNEKSFQAAYEAFRLEDPKGFQGVLKRLRPPLLCRLVCEWIRIKECVFLCFELCGPPPVKPVQVDPRVLAQAVVRVTSNEKLVSQLVAIVEKRDRAAFQRFVKAQKLGPFCHLFCHWVCLVRYRLVCQWLCQIEGTEKPNLAVELQTAGKALRALVENKQAFDAAVAASQAGDAAKLSDVLGEFELIPWCRWICEWFCSWRCVLVCLEFCREFPLKAIDNEVQEAYAFAKEIGALAQKPAELQRLVTAVGSRDAKTYSALVTELQLQVYCIQLCHWICFLWCRRFCWLVCPVYPWFSAIGVYDYTLEIDSAVGGTGLTLGPQHPGNYAFFLNLRLNGVLTQTMPGGQPMEYRFETIETDAAGNPLGGAVWKPVLPAQIAATHIGWWQPTNKKYWVNQPMLLPGEQNAFISNDGWIRVPQNVGGNFISNGNMIELISQTLTSGAQDETGTTTGSPAKHPLVQDHYFGIRMRARAQFTNVAGIIAGTCVHVAIDNTLYNNVKPHPAWDGGAEWPPGQWGVVMVNIDELGMTGCQGITDSLTVRFTAAHPNLGGASMTLTGGGGTHNFDLVPAAPGEAGDWFGTAVPDGTWSVATLPACAYLVELNVDILLTTGDSWLIQQHGFIAFCKKA